MKLLFPFALLILVGCMTMSADPRLVGRYVADNSEALIFAGDTGVYHSRMVEGKERRMFLGYYGVSKSTSRAGELLFAGPDTSPFIGTSFQVSEDFARVTARWGTLRGDGNKQFATEFRRVR